MSAAWSIQYSCLLTPKMNHSKHNIPPIRKLLPFRLRCLPNLRVVGQWEVETWVTEKFLQTHFTQQVSLLIRSHKIRDVIGVLGPWDMMFSKVHLWEGDVEMARDGSGDRLSSN